MQGNQRERHCEARNKHVHNLSAMTPLQIEHLVREKEGHLCASVTYRSDGSIRTLDGPTQPSVAAGMVLAASLAFSSHAAAESASKAPDALTAHLSGTVLLRDGTGPLAGAYVILRSNHVAVASTRTDAKGNFLITAQPGQYDIWIGPNILFGVPIHAADLHEGDQSLQPLRVAFQSNPEYVSEFTTGGAMAATYTYPISYLFKHPIRYLKHLPHNF
jgi:hypothetical protein